METKDKLNHQQDDDNTRDNVTDEESTNVNHESVSGPIPSRKDTHNDSGQKKAYHEIVEWIKAIVIAVALVFVVRTFLFSPFIVDGASMEPNFHTQERIIVNLLVYRFSEPSYGDVIVFDVPEENRRFIKRIIGVPGDTIVVSGDEVYVNSERIDEPYLAEAIAASHALGETYNGLADYYSFPNSSQTENVVPEGYYFVMGDNRSDSTDSRAIGFVSEDEIIGRADVVMWPFDKVKFIKHYN